MKDTLDRLEKITINCRDNMHEPDEQGLTVRITGMRFDNAHGDDPDTNHQEFTVGIFDEFDEKEEWFNLATLIALARKAKLGE